MRSTSKGVASTARNEGKTARRIAENPTVTHAGKIILLVGLALVAIGAIVWTLGKLGFRGLPGDIAYESDRVKIFFPIVTCLVLSVVGSVVLWIVKTLAAK